MYNHKIVDKKEILHVRTVSDAGIYCSSDRVGTVCNKCSKIPTVNITALCNSCEDMACCSSECVLTFFYAADNILYVNEQFVSCIHFYFCTLHYSLNPINKNLKGLSPEILVAS